MTSKQELIDYLLEQDVPLEEIKPDSDKEHRAAISNQLSKLSQTCLVDILSYIVVYGGLDTMNEEDNPYLEQLKNIRDSEYDELREKMLKKLTIKKLKKLKELIDE